MTGFSVRHSIEIFSWLPPLLGLDFEKRKKKWDYFRFTQHAPILYFIIKFEVILFVVWGVH